MNNNNSNNTDNILVFETLQNIKNGLLDPKLLSRSERLACVEVLLFEGHHHSLIANLLKKCDRTIRRDIAKIRERNALKATPELTQILIGEFIINARNQYSRLKQISREGNASIREKMQTEFLAWRVYDNLIDRLHLIGFILPAHCQEEIGGFSEEEKSQKSLLERSEKDKEIARQYSLLGPMDRERLIEKLHKDIINIDEEIAKEEQEETLKA